MKEIVIFSVSVDSTLHEEKLLERPFDVKSLENVNRMNRRTLALLFLLLVVEVPIQLSRSASVSMFEIISAPHLLSLRSASAHFPHLRNAKGREGSPVGLLADRV